MKTAVIYARYSSDRQTEQSIEGQLHICNDYAKRNKITVIDSYIDRAMTGTNDKRTSFQKMLKDSNKRAWDYVLVYKLDRFSRNKYEMAMHKKTLKDNGVKLISCMENIPDTPEGIILESLLEGMAEYYSAELSQKVKRGMNETRQKGNFPGGYLLYGYKKDGKKVIVNDNEASIIRWMFNEVASGKEVIKIYEELKQNGILHRNKPFTRSTVYHMLSNEKYIGIHKHDGEIYTNIYPPIVSKDIFSIVKEKTDNNKYGKHVEGITYLLKFKATCGYCGSNVNSDAGTSANGSVVRYYNCRSRTKKIHCCFKAIRKETLENLVIETTLEAFNNKKTIDIITDRILNLHKTKQNDRSLLNILQKDRIQVEKSIENILDCMEKGITTDATKERLINLERQHELISEKILNEQVRDKKEITKNDITKYLIQALRKKPKQMIDLLVKEVKIWNDKIEIYYNYTDKDSPDGKTRWDCSFYDCVKTFTTGSKHKEIPDVSTIKLKLLI